MILLSGKRKSVFALALVYCAAACGGETTYSIQTVAGNRLLGDGGSALNATVIAILLICAMSLAGALFLIVELDQPFNGLIQISSKPLRDALGQLGQ
jgi:hypothetical protein